MSSKLKKYASRSQKVSGIPRDVSDSTMFNYRESKSELPVYSGNSHSIRHRKFGTNFCRAIKNHPPQTPPSLLKIALHEESSSSKKKDIGQGRVKVMLRVCPQEVSGTTSGPSLTSAILNVCENKRSLEIHDPSNDLNSAHRRMGVTAPKVFSFDAIFPEDVCQLEVSNSCLVDVIQSVVQGADGAVFCYGHAGLGKTHTMFGQHGNTESLGVVPCAITWLYRAVGELQNKQKCKYSIRVSALELHGRSEELRDLLVDYSREGGNSKSVRVEEDPLFGTQIQNLCELRASSVEKAAFLLDAALNSRSASRGNTSDEVRRHSHFIYTLNVYQYGSNANGKFSGASGSRSRLHFIDLGSCERTLVKTSSSLILSLNSLGHVIMAIVNNSKHVPFKESKLTCVLRELLGNFNCRAVMLAHVARNCKQYADTLSTVQMASRIHRVLLKRKPKATSGNGKIIDYELLLTRSNAVKSDGTSSGVDGTSGSELSCDTVIYVRPNGSAYSDRELTDNEGPPRSLPIPVPSNNLVQIGEQDFDVDEASVASSVYYSCLEQNNNNSPKTPKSKKVPPPVPPRTVSAIKPTKQNLPHNVRQEPDGCDYNKNIQCVPNSTLKLAKYIEELEHALSALDQNDVCVAHQTTYNLDTCQESLTSKNQRRPLRPNENATKQKENEVCLVDSDDSEVEVNFYCLSVTTNKHNLVPLSRRTVAKQVQNSKVNKSIGPSRPIKKSSQTCVTAVDPVLRRSETFVIESAENSHSDKAVLSEANSTVSSPSQLILYDSNSLEINYVKPKSCRFPKQKNNVYQPMSETSQNLRTKAPICNRNNQQKANKMKNITSKSAPSVGPKLSLVKKNGRDSPLELIITERENRNNSISRSQSTTTQSNNLVFTKSRPNSMPTHDNNKHLRHDPVASSVQSKSSRSTTKSSKNKLSWSGFKKLGASRKRSGTSSKPTSDICFSICATDVDRCVPVKSATNSATDSSNKDLENNSRPKQHLTKYQQPPKSQKKNVNRFGFQ